MGTVGEAALSHGGTLSKKVTILPEPGSLASEVTSQYTAAILRDFTQFYAILRDFTRCPAIGCAMVRDGTRQYAI